MDLNAAHSEAEMKNNQQEVLVIDGVSEGNTYRQQVNPFPTNEEEDDEQPIDIEESGPVAHIKMPQTRHIELKEQGAKLIGDYQIEKTLG